LVPDSFSGLEHIIPLLRSGEAIIVGDSTPMPQRVIIDYPTPPPQSSSIPFFVKWRQSDLKVDINEIMERWWTQKKGP
jgi:hypothetical protein